MTENQEESAVRTVEEPPKKSSAGLIIVLGIVAVVLGAGGYFGYTRFLQKDAAEGGQGGQQSASASEKREKDRSIVYPIEPFIVNLLDQTGLGKRYLKITIELELLGEESGEVADAHKTRLKDTILLLLSGLAFNEINTIEGKLDLKQSLLSRINQVLGTGIVRRIYFTEFVVQ